MRNIHRGKKKKQLYINRKRLSSWSFHIPHFWWFRLCHRVSGLWADGSRNPAQQSGAAAQAAQWSCSQPSGAHRQSTAWRQEAGGGTGDQTPAAKPPVCPAGHDEQSCVPGLVNTSLGFLWQTVSEPLFRSRPCHEEWVHEVLVVLLSSKIHTWLAEVSMSSENSRSPALRHFLGIR